MYGRMDYMTHTRDSIQHLQGPRTHYLTRWLISFSESFSWWTFLPFTESKVISVGPSLGSFCVLQNHKFKSDLCSMWKVQILKRVGTPLWDLSIQKAWESFTWLTTLFGTCLPLITFSLVGGWDQRNQKTHSVSRKHIASFMSFVMEVNLHARGAKTVGGGSLIGAGSGYQVHSNVLWLVGL